MDDPSPSPRQRIADTLAGALPNGVVRWAAARGAPAARLSGRTAIGSAALSRALSALATPPRRWRDRDGAVGVEEVAERLGRDPDEIRRWETAGLLAAPDRPDGANSPVTWDRHMLDRAALVDLALRSGADEAALARAAAQGNLMWVALERVLTGRGDMTGGEAAERAGVAPELVRSVWRALGMPADEFDWVAFDRQDVHALRTLGALRVVFTDEDLSEAASVVGRAMAEVSSAVTELFRRRLAEPFLEGGGTESDVVIRLAAIRDLLVPTMAPLLEIALRRHLEAAIRLEVSVAMEQLLEPGSGQRALSVAFADLVGFTAASEQLPLDEVRGLAASLYRTVEDVVIGRGGRVVKGIGDAIMFTTADPLRCAQAALEVVERVTADPAMPPVRVGIGHGPVLPAYADYFGRTVNLASRLCGVAGPGEVLLHVDGAPPDTQRWHAEGLVLDPRRIPFLKGIDGPVETFAVRPA